MITHTQPPADRASFDSAVTAILSDHATLRRLANTASKRGFSSDDTMSLAEAMAGHESAEARLFALPFITCPPEAVIASAARANQRRLAYTSGNCGLQDTNSAAALFVEALLVHLAAEEAWLGHEAEHQKERRLIIA